MRGFIDVSLPIGPDLLTWPGDPGVEIERTLRLEAGDAANVSTLRIGTHTGTHVDPPVHFLEGTAGIDGVPLELLVGPALLVELPGYLGWIGPAELEGLAIPAGTERLLLKTGNSSIWRQERPAFPAEYAALSVEGARWIVEGGIRLVGIDFLSIERDGPPEFAVHRTLLAAGVAIVEGLDLAEVEPGEIDVACLPLRIAGGDGGPARAIVMPR